MSNALSPSQWQKIPEIIKYATGKEVLVFEPISIGVMTHKILCKTEDNRKYIIRIYPRGRENILESEVQIIIRFRKIGLPVPNIITTSINGPNIGLNYFVYPRIEGMMLSSYLNNIEKPKIDFISTQLINIFNKLSSLKIENYGELVNGYKANYHHWNEFITDSIKNGRDGFYNSDIFPKDRFKAIEKIIIPNLNKSIKCDNHLIWGDTSIDNILVKKTGEISGVIDFESCLSGPQNCTIGYFINTLTPRSGPHESLVDCLLKNIINKDEIYSFSVLRAYRLCRFINAPLPTGRKRDALIDIFPGLKWASDFFINKL